MVLPLLVSAQGITFEHGTLKQALAKAKAENKLVFIDGFAVWCGPCKVMSNTVFKEDKVGKYFDENLVAIKVDVEKGEGPMIKRNYGISGLPGYVFLDGDGNVVYRFDSMMPTDKFMQKVQLAVSYGKEPNSVGRLAEMYEAKKNDEDFLRIYLNKLKESLSTNYTDVLEQYLKIETKVPETSQEMVKLISDHSSEIVFGGIADRIYSTNIDSDAWKPFIRKDIRENFQNLSRMMVDKTTDYAIQKKDTTLIELTLTRAAANGIKVDDERRKTVYAFYYLQTGEGEKYKKIMHDDIETYVNSIDVPKLRSVYENWQAKIAAGDQEALSMKPFAIRESDRTSFFVRNYGQFAKTTQEKAAVLRWAKVVYDLIPGNGDGMSLYANVLYNFGDKKEALKIKEAACNAIQKKEGSHTVGIVEDDFNAMKAGQPVQIR